MFNKFEMMKKIRFGYSFKTFLINFYLIWIKIKGNLTF